MDPHALVKPLEAAWQSVLDDVLRDTARPGHQATLSTRDVAKLAPKVAELSVAYNTGLAEGRGSKLPLDARIAFSFPRDVPKGGAAVRELVASGVLTLPPLTSLAPASAPGDLVTTGRSEDVERPLRLLDLGAGLGAMTWGVVRALASNGAKGRVDALLVDEDEEVLRAAKTILRAAENAKKQGALLSPLTKIDLTIETRKRTLRQIVDELTQQHELFDVVLLGQVLSEIDPRAEASLRVESHAALITRLIDRVVAPNGALVIVEPALRERTRHLHAVRDRVLEQAAHVNVFAPCLHRAKCPALAIETEWCHEDLAKVDLPPWVTPLARAAGLRWQGLTFSYLVLRKDERRLLPSRPAHTIRFRAISHLLRTKGKAELFVCTEEAKHDRIRRLDRDAQAEHGVPFDDIRRGDVVSITSRVEEASRGEEAEVSAIDERGRVKANVEIDVANFSK